MIRDVLGRDEAARATALAILLVAAIFTLWPSLDPRVSAEFFFPATGRWLGQDEILQAVRETIRIGTMIVPLVALVALLVAVGRPHPFGLPARLWGFILTLYLLGPALLVNLFLKAHWGRARPSEVTLFGGDAQFTAPLVATDQCARNCSFTSGEAAGAMAFTLSLLLIADHLPARAARLHRVLVALAVIVGLLGPALRVAAGRHFPSDTLFSVLFVLAVAQVAYLFFWPRSAAPAPVAVRARAVDTP